MRVRALVAIVFAAGMAHADAESDAKDLFVRGRGLREHGNCGDAAPLFRRAIEIYPKGLGSLRNLAECEEQLGHYASARRAWLDLARALLVEHDVRYKNWDTDAKKAAEALAPKVAALRVEIDVVNEQASSPATKTSPIRVRLNGETVPLEVIGTTMDRDPGAYTIRVDGEKVDEPVQRSFELFAGGAEVVKMTVRLKREPKATEAQITNPPPPAEPKYKTSPAMLVAGWTTAIAGALAIGGSAIAFGIRQDALSELERRCPQYATMSCDPSLESVVSRGQTSAGVSTALLIGGAITLGAGLFMVLLAPAVKVRVVEAGALQWRFE